MNKTIEEAAQFQQEQKQGAGVFVDKKILNHIKTLIGFYSKNKVYNSDWHESQEAVVEWLDQAQSASPKQKGVWIKASPRLPKDKQRVLYFPTTESCYNYKSYKLRLGIFLKKDQWERENMFCDGSFISADKIAVWMPAPEYNQFDKSETHIPEKGNIEQSFKIFKGDEVNSILAATLRTLNKKQLLSLKEALIERTPQELITLNEPATTTPAHSGEELWDEVENIIDYYRVWGDDSTAKQQLKLKFNITKK